MPVAAEHAGGGPVYFAWVDAAETTFGPEHVRYDEYIFKLNIHQEEGQLPTAALTMKNPGALLATGRKRHCWIAFLVGGEVVPKFFGSVVAIPSAINQRVVDVQFIAKPADYLARKQAAADALKVPPYYSRRFVDDKFADDPDTILEGLPADWHHDPVTHAVTVSDKIVGEDGVKEFTADKVIFGSLDWSIGDPPKRAVKMVASVTFKQQASGEIELPEAVFQGPIAGGVMQAWPKAGSKLDGGWGVVSASAIDRAGVDQVKTATYSFSWKNIEKEHINGDTMSHNGSYTGIDGYYAPPPGNWGTGIDYSVQYTLVIGDEETGQAGSASQQWSQTEALVYDVVGNLTLSYAAARERTEHLQFTLRAGLQDVVNDDGSTDDIETLALSGGDVGRTIDEGDSDGPYIPIGQLKRRDYFSTRRGLEDVEYVINVARAYLLSNCRAVAVSFTTPFAQAIDVSCRMNALVHDPSLPNGEVLGKVTSVDLDADGTAAMFSGKIGLACAVGKADAVAEVEGTPTYVDADVLGPDVQVFDGRFIAIGSGDLVYTPPVNGVNDDGLTFPLQRDEAVVRWETIANGNQEDVILALALKQSGVEWESVTDVINDRTESAKRVHAAFKDVKLYQELELKPLDGAFEATHNILVGPLSVPEQAALS